MPTSGVDTAKLREQLLDLGLDGYANLIVALQEEEKKGHGDWSLNQPGVETLGAFNENKPMETALEDLIKRAQEVIKTNNVFRSAALRLGRRGRPVKVPGPTRPRSLEEVINGFLPGR